MPNHCCNSLSLPSGSLETILETYVRKDEEGNDFLDFELIDPLGAVPDWYEQRLEKWGTTWNGYDLYKGETHLEFYTAWSPPVPLIRKLAELHQDMVFKLAYYEPGMMFRGEATATWQDGEVLLDEHDWNMTDDDLRELGLIDEDEPVETGERTAG